MSGGMLELTYTDSQEPIVKFSGIQQAGGWHIDNSKSAMMEYLHRKNKQILQVRDSSHPHESWWLGTYQHITEQACTVFHQM